MHKNDAVAFVNALNRIQREVRPLDFEPLQQNPIARTILAVANGTHEAVITEVKSETSA